MKRLLKNAHLICPVQGFDDIGHIGMTNGSISHSSLGSPKDESGFDEVIDCQGQYVTPGLIDMRVQSADPGAEHLETLDSLLKAAAHSGITSVVSLPDTAPVIDNRAVIDSLSLRALTYICLAGLELRCGLSAPLPYCRLRLGIWASQSIMI